MERDDQLFELLTQMYSEMQGGFKRIDGEIQGIRTEMHGGFKRIDGELQGLKSEVKEIKERVINIENDHGKKLTALFDGYKQNSDKLDRIQNEVSKHEEIIMRRIK